jgi:predicted alpha-1,6-mannanase (GH76 family)
LVWLSCFYLVIRTDSLGHNQPTMIDLQKVLLLCTSTLITISTFPLSNASPLSPRDLEARASPYLQWSHAAVDHLNTVWYNQSSGMWNNQWWQSANAMAMIGDLATVDPTYKDTAEKIFATSLINAANGGGSTNFDGFFYDDMGWWAVAWIRAYDLTGNATYLQTAEAIFQNMLTGQNTPCGGIWWSKARANLATISNTLYLSIAAKLANRAAPDKKASYKGYAMTQWKFFNQSGLINSENLVCDGLNMTCQISDGCVALSYTAGVLIGGLIELDTLDPNPAYLDVASKVGNAAITKLVTNDILSQGGDNLNSDFAQFKGAFARNLMLLHQAKPEQSFVDFFQKNAESIWANDRNAANSQLGPLWQGPYVDESTTKANLSDMPSQNSAVSCLLGAHVVVGS